MAFDRKAFKAELERMGYSPAPRFTIKRVSFEDLARGEALFVTIDASIKGEDWDALKAAARSAGGILH